MPRIPNDSSTTPVTDAYDPGLQDREIKKFVTAFLSLKLQDVNRVKNYFSRYRHIVSAVLSSFPVTYKVVDFEDTLDIVISHINF